MAKRGRAANDDMVAPTPEQLARGAFIVDDTHDKQRGGVQFKIGKAYRRRRMVEVLRGQELISHSEAEALLHYRHHADLSDHSPLRDSIRNLMRVSGAGYPPTIELLNAMRIAGEIEAAAGSLRDVLRAVVVDDLSLSQWAMTRHGAREKCRTERGKQYCWMEPSRKGLELARLDFLMATRRVVAELAA